MSEQDILRAIANSLRCLSVDMIQMANSGHPGLPLGMADVMAVLYSKYFKHDPLDYTWSNRDRFVLSAGHGSALLYATLHLSGYDLPLSQLRQFRQLHSQTAGHPEYGHTLGVEATTGPLAAGFAMAVGMAIAEANLAKRFNTLEHRVVDHKTYVLMGDGCMMEGLSSEAASLAGHLKLGKLIAIYDSNGITIEGSTELALSEDVAKRFDAYGWRVVVIDGHNFSDIENVFSQAAVQEDGDKPLLIIAKTTIGKGSPNKAGSHAVHGTPLGQEEIRMMRKDLGVPEDVDFYIAPEASARMQERLDGLARLHKEYQTQLLHWQRSYPELARQWQDIYGIHDDKISLQDWCGIFDEESIATRVASGRILQQVEKIFPSLIGGSADLAPSNNTYITAWNESFSTEHREAKNLHFGVREHAMASVVNGLQLHGGFRPFCATFLVFSDYMRPAMRLAALMKLPIIYILTHDSIYVGEDGPTHQPVEHLEALRAIPNMSVLRPSDAHETAWAWHWALRQKEHPVVLALSRQNLPILPKPRDWDKNLDKGGYIIYEPEAKDPQVVVLATGSEVSLAYAVIHKTSVPIRIVSVGCRTLLERNSAHCVSIMGKNIPVISVEAGVRGGWSLLAKSGGLYVDSFGFSGKADDVAGEMNMTTEALVSLIELVASSASKDALESNARE